MGASTDMRVQARRRHAGKSLGTGATRAKTGCRTCKIRRVKCDEGRPACQRCISTGRVCDGYGIWGGGGNQYGQRVPMPNSKASTVTPCLRLALRPSSAISAEEQVYVDWFAYRSCRKLPGAFYSSFWRSFLFQASADEPAVLHAVLALSAAHKTEMLGAKTSHTAYNSLPDEQEQFLLRHYSKAITHLLPLFSSKSRASVQVALIACLAFTFMEYMRGHFNAGNTHLRNGLKLLLENRSPSSVDASLPRKGLDDCIIATFIRLQVATGLFQQDFQQLSLASCVSVPRNSGPLFHSVEQARLCLDLLLSQVLELSEQHRLEDCDGGPAHSQLLRDQRRLQAAASSWLRTYKASETSLCVRLNPRESLAYQLLHVYYTMTSIMADTCLRTTESVFDSHLPRFTSIVTHMLDLARNLAPLVLRMDEGLAHGPEMTGSTSDIGWLPPLYYTALKCRNHTVRTRVTRMLDIGPHKEGIWDARLVAAVAKEVIAVEEGDFYKDVAHCDDVLPEARRLHEVQVLLPKDPSEKVVLTGSRRRDDGVLETINREYCPLSRRWTGGESDGS
ncbi:Zn2/Cys6 DNA-binding protein [Pleurostoma richardsiae]|uniref:Zn2/Cys6 DNA-binding protein n=1 Tax=Pleurostoma richardsiae TaxID=41990 RepID=A0AA38R5Q4_9PEZI|nr:Zn2/Cys6 DNA-binding protein [Pleurostoma richardsiae]